MPLVRCIIPTYNRASLLKEAIQSVLSQTFQDFEIIVVDDGSTDNTQDVMDRFFKHDSRIHYVRKNNGGVASARNVGIGYAGEFEYIAFLDADDLWLSHHLEKSIEALEHETDVSILFSRIETLDYAQQWSDCSLQVREDRMRWTIKNASKISTHSVYILDPAKSFQGVLRNEMNPHPSTLIVRVAPAKKSLWFDESLTIFEDVDFFFRLGLQGLIFGFIDAVHCQTRYYGDNLTGLRELSSPVFLKRQLAVLKYYKQKMPYCSTDVDKKYIARQIAEQAYLVGQSLSEQSHMAQARHVYIESFRYQPSYRALKGLIATLLPMKLYALLRNNVP